MRRVAQHSVLAFMLGVTAGVGAPAQAAMRHEIHIPAQPLGAAIAALARQTECQIIYSADLVAGRAAAPLSGSMTLEQALETLLDHTGLTFEFLDAHTITLAAGSPPKSESPVPASPRRIALAQAEEPAAAPAPAAPAEALQEVVVTGSSIRGATPVGSAVVALDNDQLRERGVTSTTDALRTLPQIFNLGADEGRLTGGNGAGANVTFGSGINLRGLGTASTLTLLDGRRVVPAGLMGQYVDPSVIPMDAIERIEVVPDGSSAIYGSDAVGGVVNIILRKKFDGVQARLRYGHADGADQRVASLLAGTTWSSGSVMAAYEHNDRDRLMARDRPFYTDDFRPWGGPDRRPASGNPGNIIVNGVSYAIPANQNGQGLTPADFTANTENRESIYRYVTALPEQTRDLLATTLTQRLNDRIELFAEGYIQYRQFEAVRNGSTLNLTVPASNAFFVNPAGTAAQSVTVAYNTSTDLGGQTDDGFSRSYTAYTGLNADLAGDWQATGYVFYGHNYEHTLQTGFNTRLLNLALADSNPQTAFNPFGAGSFTNPDTIAHIRSWQNIDSQYDRAGGGAKVDGSLFALPAGDTKLAVGVDYYHDRYQQLVRNSASTPDNSFPPYNRSDIRRDVKSLFAELYVPLVGAQNEVPAVHSLALSLAGRVDDYSDFGSTTNPKVGLEWMPLTSLKLHASFGKSFRAPTPSNLDNQGGEFITVQNFADAGGTLTRGLFVRGGNPDLGPERARTYSFGVDFTPDWSFKTRASVNYFYVDYKDQIGAPGTDPNVLLTPLLSLYVDRTPDPAAVANYMARPSFQGQPEDPANIKVIVDGRSQNTSRVVTRGLESQLQFGWNTRVGFFDAGASALYLFDYDQALLRGAPLTEVVGTLNNPQRLQARGQLGWHRNGMSATTFINYSGRYRNTTVTPIQRIGSYTTVDVAAGYDFGAGQGGWVDGLRVQLSAQNLFDEEPPPVFNGLLAFDPQVASALGRMVSFEVVKKF
ncbi:MAG TPA: TonB-dependent receptor [Steroidobacteraceae bacterium]|nr:TonB-dependent receptor [Steroidobacteraceae bacterium]